MKKMNLMVCPHDTARNPERWFLFAQQLNKMLDANVSFKPSFDFVDFHRHFTNADLIYSNPQDSLTLFQDFGYLPLVRPADLYDEVVFIANLEQQGSGLQAITGQPVASVMSMMPTHLAVEHLQRRGFAPGTIINKDSWMAVIRAVYSGDVAFGFVYRDFYQSLGNLTQKAVAKIGSTQDEKIYHMVMLNPDFADRVDDIQQVLVNFHQQSQSQQVLEALGISRFLPADAQTLAGFARLTHVLHEHSITCA